MTEESGQKPKPEGSDEGRPKFTEFKIEFFPHDLEFETILTEMAQQTPRGLALLCGAVLEWRVRQVIEHNFIRTTMPPHGNKKKPSNIASFVIGSDKKPGELSFYHQCDLAYCMGLIGPATCRDLQRMGQIRNKFAHHMEINSFDATGVENLCKELETRILLTEAARRVPWLLDDPRFANLRVSDEVETNHIIFYKGFITLFTVIHTMSEMLLTDWVEPKEGQFPYV